MRCISINDKINKTNLDFIVLVNIDQSAVTIVWYLLKQLKMDWKITLDGCPL